MEEGGAPESFYLVLYDVPDEPSRIKVGIWRRLKRLGGLYPKLSVCIVPAQPGVEERLRGVVEEIRMHGCAAILRAEPVSGEDKGLVYSLFRAEREREYREILEECQEFLDEVKRNLEVGNVTPEEYEELEEMLSALKKWFERVRARDWASCPEGRRVEEAIARCEEELERFAERVLSGRATRRG